MKSNPIKWHGGKSYLASWIISLMPERKTPDDSGGWHLFREPYFGGGAVLFRLDPEGLSEAVNDIHHFLTTFWNVLANENQFKYFHRIISAVPFCEEKWKSAVDILVWCQTQQSHIAGHLSHSRPATAAAFFICYRQSRQGLGKDFATPTKRLRRGMNENVSAWLSAVEGLPEAHERLKRVEIRNMDALKFIKKYDDPKAVFYCDPPYLIETRHGNGGEYEHEMTDKQHADLLVVLGGIDGRFLLSGYHSELYDTWADIGGFRCHEKQIPNQASSKKTKEKMTECVWTNY